MTRLLVLSLFCSLSVFGQATRTWISGVGDDVNPCSRTAPCKTFAGAISKTAAGGEIDILDPGSFGAVTITKSITLSGVGSNANVQASGANSAITVNAGNTDTVIIRNLDISGVGVGTNGINYVAGGNLIVENVAIRNFTNNGINVSLTANGNVTVRNSEISGVSTGIRMTSTTGTLNLSATRVAVRQSVNGIWMSYGNAAVTNSTFSQLTGTGLMTDGTGKVFAATNLISGNATGLQAGNATSIGVSNNDVVDNTLGFACVGTGAIKTATNNRKADNLGGASECAPSATITVQ